MKRINKKGGFTLIELLVVIAIIGILSSIVLVSLNSARKKGTDTRVISDVQETRTALESGYNGSAYPDLNTNAACVANNFNVAAVNINNTSDGCLNSSGPDFATIQTLANDAQNEGGALYVTTTSTPISSYAIRGQLTSNSGTFFCIDSTGKTNPTETYSSTNSAGTCY